MPRIQTGLAAAAAALFAAPASAQMAVSTFGATDAVLCYEAAASDFGRETEPCDAALRGALSPSDRKKTLVNRGIIHNRNGELPAALEDFNEALDIDSGLAEAFLNRGNTYYLNGSNDAAISDYQRSLDLGVNKPWAAWYNIGLAYESKQDRAKAREAYEKALELNPDFSLAQSKLAGL
jgi:tetratricopeptide (TPR) repeat protein